MMERVSINDNEEVGVATYKVLKQMIRFAMWIALNKIHASELDLPNTEDFTASTDSLLLEKVADIFEVYTINFFYTLIMNNFKLVNDDKILFYKGRNPTVAPIVVRLLRVGIDYPYPPATVQSALFYMLNPEIELEARRLIKDAESELGVETAERFTTFQSLLSSLPRDLSDIDIAVNEHVEGIYAKTEISFSQHMPELKTIESIGAERENRYNNFFVRLIINGRDAEYIIRDDEPDYTTYSLGLLLTRFVPESELRYVEKILTHVRDAVVKTYLVLATHRKVQRSLY